MADQKRLDEFSRNLKTAKMPESKRQPSFMISGARKRALERSDPVQFPYSYLVSAFYDGNRASACLKLYEPKTGKIYLWHDTYGHKPYLLTNLSPYELDRIDQVRTHPGLDHHEETKKINPLSGQATTLTKVIAKDPLAIGGRPRGCLRDIIPEESAKVKEEGQPEAKVWEATIRYYQCYIFDRGLIYGMPYKIENSELIPAFTDAVQAESLQIGETKEEEAYVQRWMQLLEYPAPQFRRVALDIEVISPVATRVPDPVEAPYEVVCASFVSESSKAVFLLRRKGLRDELERLPPDTETRFFEFEKDLIEAIFEVLWDYPFLITFNGDDFDLRYLAHRAQKLGIPDHEIPIEVRRRVCLLKSGIHIDLYKFFYNRSIQIYAFSSKYKDVTLDAVGKALINLPKLKLEKTFAELNYLELARYCLRDSEITYELTSFSDNLSMKLILVLSRISKMPMEDVSRQGVSRWIRSFLQFEHRRLGWLIPNASDILALKGETATTAIIKGKKYKGAIVVKPVPGVHFHVAVMDFPSLYPSIIKVWNLGYQTMLCSHEECKSNLVPGTPHWVCQKEKSLESLLIGSLRDLRVNWYKLKAKDETLPPDQRNWYNVVQQAMKVILNASYGVFGAESFDLYCPPLAEATAAIGRHLITSIVKKAKDLGIQVLYGDTDSVFLKNPTDESIKELAEWSEKELKIGLDVDKEYRYAVFSSRKKNYLGVLMDGSVDVKGMTGKKKHIPRFIKDAFNEMKERLGRVTSSLEFDTAKKDIKRTVLDRYTRLRRREWDALSDLAFHVSLGASPESYRKTTPQHVMAARILKDKQFEMKAGDRVSFIKIKPREMIVRGKKESISVMPVQYTTDSEVDVDKYVAYLRSTFDQVLDAIGLEFDEIIGLTKLERFM